MSSEQPVAAPAAAAPSRVVNEAWFLHSAGRVFGPMDEHDIRSYFRAGMVKANDTLASPGQVGKVSALEAAALLGLPAPMAAAANTSTAPLAPPTAILVTEVGEAARMRRMYVALAVAVVAGALYFIFHAPYQPPSNDAANLPFAVTSLPQAPIESPTEAFVASTEPTQQAGAPAAADPFAAQTMEKVSVPSKPASYFDNLALPAATEAAPAGGSVSDEWWRTASQLKDQKDWANLRAHAQQWTQAQPHRDLAWWYLGVAHYRLGDYASTVAACDKGLAVSPRHMRMRWLKSDAYIGLSRWQDSLGILNVLVREEPREEGLWNDVGLDYSHLGEYDDAIAALEKAVQLDPGFRLAWGNLAQAYAHFGNMDRANAALAKANGR